MEVSQFDAAAAKGQKLKTSLLGVKDIVCSVVSNSSEESKTPEQSRIYHTSETYPVDPDSNLPTGTFFPFPDTSK